MNTVPLESGVCLGFGGTNARMAVCEGGDISGFISIETPTQPKEFFDWMARRLLDAADNGREWLVAGFPGPVSPDGQVVGPMANVSGMSNQQYSLRTELQNAEPEVERVLDHGFRLVAVNDGTLNAQSAAARVGNHMYNRTGALILGTGVGAGVVDKDPGYARVYRADTKNPYEIGHLILSGDPFDRFEDRFSGPGLTKRYNQDPRDIPAGHPAWQEVGVAVGRLAMIMGLMNGVELVVPCSGVGAGASDKYKASLEDFMIRYRTYGNGAQKLFAPDIKTVDPKEAQVFEMFGAEGVMRDHLTKATV